MSARFRSVLPIALGILLALNAGEFAAAQENLGPPAWIRPGMRLTFYAASAATGAGEILVPDDQAMEHEKEKAQKKADETGKTQYYTYWKDDRGQQYSVGNSPGASGQGYVELNVAYVDQATAVIEARLYGIDVATNIVRAPTTTGQVVAAHTGADYWIHPAILRRMIGATTAGVAVRRMRCRLHGHDYDAVQIRVRTNAGFTQKIYDLASGVLLRLSSATTRGANAWVPDAGGTSHYGGGGTTLVEAWLVGTRQLQLPWIGMPPPAWVRQTRRIIYTGTQGAFVPGTGNIAFPYTATFSVGRSGPGWMEFLEDDEVSSPYGMPPQQAQANRAVGTNQLGGLWVPPAALARLRPGQSLDDDPVTHVRVSVESVEDGRATLLEAGAQYQSRYVYDMSNGMLVAMNQQQQVGATTAQASLQLRSRE